MSEERKPLLTEQNHYQLQPVTSPATPLHTSAGYATKACEEGVAGDEKDTCRQHSGNDCESRRHCHGGTGNESKITYCSIKNREPCWPKYAFHVNVHRANARVIRRHNDSPPKAFTPQPDECLRSQPPEATRTRFTRVEHTNIPATLH